MFLSSESFWKSRLLDMKFEGDLMYNIDFIINASVLIWFIEKIIVTPLSYVCIKSQIRKFFKLNYRSLAK